MIFYVLGLDFSAEALKVAQGLASELGLSAPDVKWVVSDVYDAVEALEGEQFDLVYVSIGSLCWLPDVKKWAAVVGRCVKPGGHFYIRDGHPMAMTLASDSDTPGYMDRPKDALGARDLLISFPYYEKQQPMTFVDEYSYDGEGKLAEGAMTTHEWNHPLGSIITALVQQGGLNLNFCNEHKFIEWQFQDHMVRDPAYHERGFGGWRLPPHLEDRCPLTFSILAHKSVT